MFKEVGKEISLSCDNDGPWEERIRGRESVFIPCLIDLIPRYFTGSVFRDNRYFDDLISLFSNLSLLSTEHRGATLFLVEAGLFSDALSFE